MPYEMIIFYFHLPYFHVLDTALFLHDPLVLYFYIDVVLTLHIDNSLQLLKQSILMTGGTIINENNVYGNTQVVVLNRQVMA